MRYLFLGVLLFFCRDVIAQEDYPYMDEETTASPLQKFYDVVFEAEESGSGDDEPRPECSMSYIRYEKMYLRGVKQPNQISFNGTTFDECQRLCCYETSFECRSFSHLEILQQCFIMNVTQDYPRVKLVYTPGHVHGELVNTDTTTPLPTTTTQPFPTPGYTVRTPSTTTPITARNVGEEPTNNETPAKLHDNKYNNIKCAKQCLHGGTCKHRLDEDIAEIVPFCDCKKGYTGEDCQKRISQAGGGFEPWMIALIVLGGVILILFLTVCIMYHVYRKKTGEYKVFEALRKWARRGRKTRAASSDVSDDYPIPEEMTHSLHRHTSSLPHHVSLAHHHHRSLAHHTSPTTSVQSIHGSVTSSATHSTMTSV